MPLVFNGVIIPENVANALTVNGVDIHDVYFNGVQVWHQSLFSGVWSGSTLEYSYGTKGLECSGNAYRAWDNTAGAWLYANASGLGSGASGIITTTPSSLVFSGGYTSYVYFNPTTKFSGQANGYQNKYVFETSGGLLRFGFGTLGKSYGAWISLN